MYVVGLRRPQRREVLELPPAAVPGADVPLADRPAPRGARVEDVFELVLELRGAAVALSPRGADPRDVSVAERHGRVRGKGYIEDEPPEVVVGPRAHGDLQGMAARVGREGLDGPRARELDVLPAFLAALAALRSRGRGVAVALLDHLAAHVWEADAKRRRRAGVLEDVADVHVHDGVILGDRRVVERDERDGFALHADGRLLPWLHGQHAPPAVHLLPHVRAVRGDAPRWQREQREAGDQAALRTVTPPPPAAPGGSRSRRRPPALSAPRRRPTRGSPRRWGAPRLPPRGTSSPRRSGAP